MSIFDIAGRQVKSLVDNSVIEAGIIDVSWDGVNDSGVMVSSGIYFVVLEMNDSRYINKVTMLK